MEILQTVEHLDRVQGDHFFVFNPAVLQLIGQTASLAILLEDEHSISMHLQKSVMIVNGHDNSPRYQSTRQCSDD